MHVLFSSDAVVVTSALMAMDRNNAAFFLAASNAVEMQAVQSWRMQCSDAHMFPMRIGEKVSA